jgi:HlyD family secretion protein
VVQDAYNQFCDAVVSYNQAVRLNIYRQQILSAQKEHASLLRHESNLKRQLEMSQQQADLVKHDRDREKSLHERKLTSDAEMEQSQRSLISAQLSVEQVRTDISQTQLSIAQIDNRLAELQVQYQQDMQHVTATLQSALNTLKVAIGQWEHLYALVAPASGKLSYTNVWAVNQNITTGQHIFSVVESRKSRFVGKVLLPATGFGKVKEGQRVNIMLDGYPYLEFGYLRGTVSGLSAVANQDVYVATITLPQGLQTTVGRELRFTGELSGQAEVITDDISLAVRIIQPLRYIFHHNV